MPIAVLTQQDQLGSITLTASCRNGYWKGVPFSSWKGHRVRKGNSPCLQVTRLDLNYKVLSSKLKVPAKFTQSITSGWIKKNECPLYLLKYIFAQNSTQVSLGKATQYFHLGRCFQYNLENCPQAVDFFFKMPVAIFENNLYIKPPSGCL